MEGDKDSCIEGSKTLSATKSKDFFFVQLSYYQFLRRGSSISKFDLTVHVVGPMEPSK
jgi:hypothetical protein